MDGEKYQPRRALGLQAAMGILATACLVIYLVALARTTLVQQAGIVGSGHNLVPLRSTFTFLTNSVELRVVIRQIGGNALLLLPLGVYLGAGGLRLRAALLGLGVASVGIEVVQLGIDGRYFDIDDVLWNVLGGTVGVIGGGAARLVVVRLDRSLRGVEPQQGFLAGRRRAVVSVVGLGFVLVLAAMVAQGSQARSFVTPDGVRVPTEGEIDAVRVKPELASYLEMLDVDDRTGDLRRRRQDVRERLVAACMEDAGHRYLPEPYSSSTGIAAGVEQGTPRWRAEYGFGITTLAFPRSMLGDELTGYEPVSEETTAGGHDSRYFRRLFGEPVADESARPPRSRSDGAVIANSGCSGYADWRLGIDAVRVVQATLTTELSETREQILASPLVLSALGEVSDCVEASGHTWAGLDHYGARVRADLLEIGRDLREPSARIEGLRLLGQLQSEEVDLAEAVDDCGGSDDSQAHALIAALAVEGAAFEDVHGARVAKLVEDHSPARPDGR